MTHVATPSGVVQDVTQPTDEEQAWKLVTRKSNDKGKK